MSKIETIKKKSVLRSTAGDALKTISTIILIAGIITSIIIFANSTVEVGFRTETNWISVTSGIEVLFSAIFLCILGRAIAKIANYAEAIYKQTNPDFEFDKFIEKQAVFMAGDKALIVENGQKIPVTIKSIKIDTSGDCVVYNCEKENNEVVECYSYQLKAAE